MKDRRRGEYEGECGFHNAFGVGSCPSPDSNSYFFHIQPCAPTGKVLDLCEEDVFEIYLYMSRLQALP
jgi:hypothetical protein